MNKQLKSMNTVKNIFHLYESINRLDTMLKKWKSIEIPKEIQKKSAVGEDITISRSEWDNLLNTLNKTINCECRMKETITASMQAIVKIIDTYENLLSD